MSAVKVHLAGIPKDGKQQCCRCHAVIERGTSFWAAGALVRSWSGGMAVVTEEQAANVRPCGRTASK